MGQRGNVQGMPPNVQGMPSVPQGPPVNVGNIPGPQMHIMPQPGPPMGQPDMAPPPVEMISQTLASMSSVQLFDLMSQFKTMAHQQPANCRNFLYQNPQVTYAFLQAMIMMGMIDQPTLQVSI